MGGVGGGDRAALLSGGKKREEGREDKAGLARRISCGETFRLSPAARHAIRPRAAITHAFLITLYSFLH